MAILTANTLSQSYGAFDVFSGISASIPNDGKVGLVGPNGIGKTTLLYILAGLHKPSTGQVHIARGSQVGYLSQEASQTFAGHTNTVYEEMLTVFAGLQETAVKLQHLEHLMSEGSMSDTLFDEYSTLQEQFEHAGGYSYETDIKQVLTGLGFSVDQWTLPLTHLSGGQKTRLLLGRLLLEKPDLLILDEPTNHLDVDAIEWLEGTLRLWPGALLVVSHDRYFLDKVVNTIWEMSRHGMETYRGNYSGYVQQRQERWEWHEKEFEALKERLDKEMDYIRRNMAGQRTQMAQGKLSRLSREVELIHAGGLGVLPLLKSKGWAQVSDEFGLAGRPSSTVEQLQSRINQLRGPTRPPILNIALHTTMRSGNIVLRSTELKIGYPGNPLFTTDAIELFRGECAALIGPNGAGKSTFLNTILGHIPSLGGEITLGASLKVGYFSQAHQELRLENSVLDELLRHQNMPVSEARNYLARYLFRGDDVYKLVDRLSGGERGRLALAILALEHANFLLLDEPTNHLDIPSQESLQEVLEQFDGTILLVSHDRYLVDRLATQIWDVIPERGSTHVKNGVGRLHVHKGSYQQYLAERAQTVEVVKVAPEPPKSNGTAPSVSKNEQRRRSEDLAKLESLIQETERGIQRLTEQIQEATQAQSFDKIQTLSMAYAEKENQLEDLMAKWEKLHE